VHRDVKSANVVVTKDECGTRAWTIDFGMSKRIIGSPDLAEDSMYDIITAA
jgi:tRNA A-37 threonylcarbamoyl transferase component Bud32